MKTTEQPRVITGRVAGVSQGIWPRVVIAGKSKDVIADLRPHQIAGCQALLEKTCCARVTEDEEGCTILIDIWQEGEQPPWERDPDGDAVMMEWWGLFRRLA